MNILIIDDDKLMRESLADYLYRFGARIELVGTADDAKAKLSAEHFDVVLLDQNLTGAIGDGASGFDLIPDILTSSPWAWIIVISGFWAEESVVEKAFALGAHDYIVKDAALKPLLLAKVAQVEARLEERRLACMTDAQADACLKETWRDLQTETNPQAKGKLLEEYFAVALKCVGGFRLIQKNAKSSFEEIDVLAAPAADSRWRSVSEYWVVECKKWNADVSRDLMDVFERKVHRRHGRATLGIFVAWNGFTAPAREAARHAGDSLTIVLVDRTDLQAFVGSADRATMLQSWIDRAVQG